MMMAIVPLDTLFDGYIMLHWLVHFFVGGFVGFPHVHCTVKHLILPNSVKLYFLLYFVAVLFGKFSLFLLPSGSKS